MIKPMEDDLEKIRFNSLKILERDKKTRNVELAKLFPHKRIMPLSKDFIRIGVCCEKYKTDQEIYIDATSPYRMLVVGGTGRGKSVFMKGITDRSFHTGEWSICILTDIKDEWKYATDPVIKDEKMLFSKKDLPKGLPIKVYRPFFFKKILEDELPPKNDYFQLPFSILNVNDLIYLLGFDSKTKQQHANVVIQNFKECKNLQELRDKIANMSLKEITGAIKKTILNGLDPLITNSVFGNDHYKDFIHDMENNVVVFNLEGFDKVGGKDTVNPAIIYAMVIQRMIEDAKRKNILKKRVQIVIEEAPIFFRIPAMAEVMEKMVKRSRLYGIYMTFAVQSHTDAPPWLIEQCNYVLISVHVSVDTYKFMMKNIVSDYKYHPSDFKVDFDELKIYRGMRRRSNWILFNRLGSENERSKNRNKIFFSSYMCLSYHKPSNV